MMSLDNLPGVAQVAIQGGKYAAKEIKNRLGGKPPQKPFKYFDKGSMATISRFSAVVLIRKIRLSGFIAWLMWLGLHLVYLTGFKNRVAALGHWAVSFLGRGRQERVTTEQQIYARRAMARAGGAATLASSPEEWNRVRAELERRAAEEARLTDDNERGLHREPSSA
jgi:NADH dehydrogenase